MWDSEKFKLLRMAIVVSGTIGLLVTLLWLSAEASTAHAESMDAYTVYYVAPGGNCGSGVVPCYSSVQAAVDAADAPGDVIKVAAGTYTDIHARAGITQVVYISKTVTIQGGYTIQNWATPNPGVNITTLDARGQGRVLYVTGAISLIVAGLRVTGGDAKGLGGHLVDWGWPYGLENLDAGGGIYVTTATVMLQDSYVAGNQAYVGGGLYLGNTATVVRNTTFTLNTATSQGGGVFLNESTATLEGNTFTGNTALYGGGAYLFIDHSLISENAFSMNTASYIGGGIFVNTGTTVITGNQFSGNSARHCGGGYLAVGDFTFRGNDVYSNSATEEGGGLCLSGGHQIVNENTFTGNQAGRSGGGLSIFCADADLVNNIVADNQAGASGSGLTVQGSSARLQHNTIVRNYGGDGSGVYVSEYEDWFVLLASTVAMTNTIIAGQTTGIYVTTGNTATMEATLWGRGEWGNQADWGGMGYIFTGTLNYYGDPAFLCADVSCPAPYRIKVNSPAIDVGVDTNVSVDIDGESRPEGAGYDLGADEYHTLYSPEYSGERLVLSFYYPWYDPLSFWSASFLADRPVYPYTSDDPVAISRHVAWAMSAGLDGFISSWWGWENTFVDGNFSRLLDALNGTHLRATIYFETWSNPNFDSPAKIVAELKYVLDRYGNHPSFLKREDRPVIFLYSVDSIAPNYPGSAYSKWQSVVDTLHAQGYYPFLVADSTNTAYLSLFDGLHTYFALQDTSVYKNVSCQAHRAGKLWAANFYPGFDDSKLYWRDPYHIVIPRNNGQTYSNTFASALQSEPDWLVQTSFNEWYENTHIEPSVNYGYEYLQRTALLSAQFHTWRAFSRLYVNPAYSGPTDGSSARPFRTLGEALNAAADGATLYLAAGVYTGPITFTRSITLVGGYDPATWTRNISAHPTILRGDSSGPVVRVLPDPCRPFTPMVTLDGLTITGGNGGVRVEGATLALVNVTLAGNRASNHGGGLLVENGGQVLVRESHILSNTASVGGGIFVGVNARATLTNTVVAQNTATVAGGGVYARPEASLSVVNSTLADNSAPGNGSGLYAWPFQPQTATIVNTILWSNSGDDLLCAGDCTVNYSVVGGGYAGTGNLSTDPLFIAPQQADYHLRYNSPAVDAGSPRGVWPTGPAPTVDIDGDPRPLRSRVDIGADEVWPVESALSANRNLARPGDVITYTIVLTNYALQSLKFWVTDTLPLAAGYVPGSARASVGTVETPLSGTLVLPYLVWKGAIPARQTARLSFAVTVPPQTALYCTTIVNTALVQSELAPGGGMITWEHTSTINTTPGTLASIAIRDAAGNSVTARMLQVGESLRLYAIGFDDCPSPNYLWPVAAQWSISGTLERQTGIGESFVFIPTRAGGQGRIVADDGRGHRAESGIITVVSPPPRITVSPGALTSTQEVGQRITRVLTLTNVGGTELEYALVPNYTFELTYTWGDGFFIDADPRSGYTLLDYYYTPEQVQVLPGGCTARVDEVELRTNGVNFARKVAWDWEAHLSNADIPLPEGQLWDSQRDPSADSGVPVHLALVVGTRGDTNSYAYRAYRNFRTGALSVYPYYYLVKRSRSLPITIADGLHAQVAVWTGDGDVTIHFDTMSLEVGGEVGCAAGWLTANPSSGAIEAGGVGSINVTFDSRGLRPGVYKTALIIQSTDPSSSTLVVPVTLVVNQSYIYLPVVIREIMPPIR